MYFSKTLVVLSVALSAMASPHMARGVNHRALAHRNAMPVAEPEPIVAPVRRKRANSSRCKTRASSSAAPTSSSIAIPQNVESAAPASSTEAAATTTEQPTKVPTSTKHSTTAQATSSASSSSSSSDDPLGILTGTHSGDGTYYATGLGACGITNSDTDFIVAVSHTLFDNYPGYNGANPNNNPLCGKKIKATYQGKSVTVTVTDRCVGCDTFSLDFSPSAFQQLASFDVGRFHDMTWVWV